MPQWHKNHLRVFITRTLCYNMLCGWGTWQFSSGRSRGGAWGACPPPTYLRVWMTPPPFSQDLDPALFSG